jgi:hypothetical protein
MSFSLGTDSYLRAADRSHVLVVVVEAPQGAGAVEVGDPSHKLAKRDLCAAAAFPKRVAVGATSAKLALPDGHVGTLNLHADAGAALRSAGRDVVHGWAGVRIVVHADVGATFWRAQNS